MHYATLDPGLICVIVSVDGEMVDAQRESLFKKPWVRAIQNARITLTVKTPILGITKFDMSHGPGTTVSFGTLPDPHFPKIENEARPLQTTL